MKKDILRVFTTNLIKVLTVLIASFFIPGVLSIGQYASYKYFALIASYIGLLHFGYCDGVFLEYGGISIRNIEKSTLANEQKTLVCFETIISALILIYGIFKKDGVFILVGLDIFPSILITYYAMMYQSTGEFGLYASVYNCISILTLLFNLALVFVIKINNGLLYAGASVAVNIVVALYSGIQFNKRFVGVKGRFYFSILSRYSKLGILLTIGNVAFILFSSIDKWFIRGLLGTNEFAYYSFAVQLLSAMNMFINPVGLTLYSYLSKRRQKDFEYSLKTTIIAVLFFMLDGVFVIKYIINRYLVKYEDAIPIIIVLFLAQTFLLLNTTIYINLFKTYKMQKQYFVNLIIAISLSAVMNTAFFFLFERSCRAIALATLTCMIFWALINLRCFSYLKLDIKHLFFVIILACSYFLTNKISSNVIGFFSYGAVWLIIMRLFARETLIQMMGWVRSSIDHLASMIGLQ